MDLLNSFDLTVYHALNHLAGHHPVLDAIMVFFAQYALELYAVLFVVAWFALPKSNSDKRHALMVAGLSGVLALLINFLISHVWFRPRPFVTLAQMHESFTKFIPHSADASFPSDHTSGSYAFASASWGKTSKWVSWAFTSIAIIVMIARVYVGVHWPTDVLASFVVGLVSSKIMWKLSPKIYPLTRIVLRMFRMGNVSNRSVAE
ncbi:undecaprenyl-diphosphatase [Fodinisporobacter ferrooxydans]|uniref:Undecaprenyl-diphosphatase n=1 Tax=Fodinisporobacter ferrooxydans TaxID=2901836 RepID=A0ABY4CJK4_9BACL|nr:undecaprenyl-diphosphatase [Alicyclobacillaceae bacterium MYW30-H2]